MQRRGFLGAMLAAAAAPAIVSAGSIMRIRPPTGFTETFASGISFWMPTHSILYSDGGPIALATFGPVEVPAGGTLTIDWREGVFRLS